MKRILIANRGEIACRIARTAHKMGIEVVAVYSEVDRGAPHVRMADQAVCLGPAPSSESYLRGDKIIEAALKTGADAIHPGYGFLSEQAHFAKAVKEAGLIFIGPSPEAIELMGSKLAAKEAVSRYDIPMVPGTEHALSSVEEALAVAERIGYANVEFRRGRIQDLALDLDALERRLAEAPVADAAAWIELERTTAELRLLEPMIPDESVDVVISNCVLNLVAPEQKASLFREIYRVLRNGGRAVISDIVSDEPVPPEMQMDAELWSGCISGALTETGFLEAFEAVGFYGIRVLERAAEPWQTVQGIEFRSVTVEAFKGKEGPCWERNQAVIYRGPFKEVLDDDGHRMVRGQRYAVCDKTFNLYRREPYASHFDFVEPRVEIPLEEAGPFDCSRTTLRHPRETKGMDYDATTEASGPCCEPGTCC